MTHTWKILDLKRTISNGVVNLVAYGCFTEHEEERTRTIADLEVTGSVDDPGFISYDDLTQEDVLGWVDANVDKAAIESQNEDKINPYIAQKAAVTEANGTPWEN